MRTSVACIVLAPIVALAACKGKPKHQEPPKTVEQPKQGSDELKLPTVHETLPKSTKPIDKATGDKLAKLTFPGFDLSVRGVVDKAVEVRQLTADFPKIAATITVATCDNPHPFECLPTTALDQWKAKEGALKEKMLSETLRDRPETKWELGTTQLGDLTMVYTYQLGQHADEKGGAYTDAYALYYNDGVNQARVVAEYKDDPSQTAEDMAKKVPKEDLEKVAKSFMDAYWTAAF